MRLWPHQNEVIGELKNLVAEQQNRIAQLESENAALKEKVLSLEKLLGKENPPPSTPSGMIPPYEKPPAKRRRKKPGRPDGHPGARRATPARIDETLEHTLSACPDCGGPLSEPVETRTRITEDIPPVNVVVTQHVIHRYFCLHCDKIVEPPVAAALPRMQIGARALVMSVFMHYFQGIPIGGVRKWMETFSSFSVSAGGLTAAWARLAVWLKPLYDALADEAKGSPVLHADETGWRVVGKTWWLWCFTSPTLVYYTIARSRGSPVVRRVLGKMFAGALVCDFFGAYNLIHAAAKQRCLAHLFRELEKVMKRNKSQEWNAFHAKLRRLLRDAMRLSERKESLHEHDFELRKDRLHIRLEELHSTSYKNLDCRRIAKRLRRHCDELFTFLDNPLVPADNNHAERQIRPAVIARKNSYCNRSPRGAETQAVLMSLFRTLHLRGLDPVETLYSIIRTSIASGSLPPLPPVITSNG